MSVIELSHGGGGAETQQLIQKLFYEAYGNEVLIQGEDAAVLDLEGKTAFTTDSFTVTPIVFNGGDIGKLAIVGTINDLAMMGAEPLYLSCAFILEEGLPLSTLKTVVNSMAVEIRASGAKIVCGDTKVVPKGAVDKLFINTSGIGKLLRVDGFPSAHGLQEGDAILVSRDIGAHGATIIAERESLKLDCDLQSDCAQLWPLVEALIANDIEIHALRDATRGGLAAVLNEWATASGVCIEVEEEEVPISLPVQGLCELLGFEAYDFANEGTFVISLPAESAEAALQILHEFEAGHNAAQIGRVTRLQPGRVIVQTSWGSQRVLELPRGELLPRIC